MIPERLQFALTCVLILYFLTIGYFLKKKVLHVKYVLLWLFSGLAMTLLVIFPEMLDHVDSLIGIQSSMNGLFIWILGFIICILLSLTAIVSRQSARIRQLIQLISRLEHRIRELENARDESGNSK